MPYDMPLALRKTVNGVCSSPLVRNYSPAATTKAVANGIAHSSAVSMRPIEPMLLLHQEQARTLRLVGAAMIHGYKALARSIAG